MSEHYIKSQYLLKQITRDFFDEQSDTIRIKDLKYEVEDNYISESESEQDDLESDEYFYLNSDIELSKVFDICVNEKDILKTYTIYICGYQIDNSLILPFLKYIVVQQDNDYTFPNFQFKCPRNIVTEGDIETNANDVYFQNLCIKALLKFMQPKDSQENVFENCYKGFHQSKTLDNTIYVIFDITNFQVKDSTIFGIIDEIINTHTIIDKAIVPEVYNIFYEIPELLHIKDKFGKSLITPISLYKCYIENEKYENEKDIEEGFISLIELPSLHPLLDDNYIFSTTALRETTNLKRYVVFITEPIYLVKNISFVEIKKQDFSLGSLIPSIFEKTPKEMVKTIKEMSESNENDYVNEEISDEEISDDEEETSQKYIQALKEKFEEVKAKGLSMIRGIKSNPPTETPDSGLIYWKELKENIKEEDYKNDELFSYKWSDNWIKSSFDVDDRRDEFSWPNGYPNEPRGTATSIHYKNQLHRIPITKEPIPINILQIALNIGQGEENYTFNDFIKVIYKNETEDEQSEPDEQSDKVEDKEILLKLGKDNSCIYYRENVDEKEIAFWLVKSNTHFIEI